MEDPTDISQTHPYTCNSCAVAFKSSDTQRIHNKSDWHMYNLKRRVASLPPITAEIFSEKVLGEKAKKQAAVAKASFEKFCGPCQKTYFSENAYENHLGSQRHRQNVSIGRRESRTETESIASGVALPVEDVRDPEAEAEFEKVVGNLKETSLNDANRPSRPTPSAGIDSTEHPLSPATVEIPLTYCLFCNQVSKDVELNLKHMSQKHGMFIPEQRYLVDRDGLLKYFQAKIFENAECMYCHRLMRNAEGVQTHMRDKGHCMVAFTTEEEMVEVGQFYDFRSTYSDDEEDDTDMAEDGWASDSDQSLQSNDLKNAVEVEDRPGKRSQPRAAYEDENELHLPNGRVLGHRSLRKYYRQNLHNYMTPEERYEKAQRLLGDGEDRESVPSRAVAIRHEGGLQGLTSEGRKQLAEVTKRDKRIEQKTRNRYQAKLEKQNNSQKHFRDPLLQ